MAEGSLRWFIQRVSGVALLVVLLVHFGVAHYFPLGDVTYQVVAQRLAQPFWKFFNLLLLGLAVYHGMNGVWSIFEDHVEKNWLRLTLLGAVLVGGLALLVVGTLTITAFQPKA